MALSRRTNPFRSSSPSLVFLLRSFVSDPQMWSHSASGEIGDTDAEQGSFDPSTWKTLDSRAIGIKGSAISSSTWTVLNILNKKGFDAYLVGGCVRDLLLKRTPKDFDVITNATLKQVKKQFQRCIIVGSRFPICHVLVQGSVVEVSSFSTSNEIPKKGKEDISSQMHNDCDVNDYIRWKNCLDRDYTINSIFFDPNRFTIYDYVGGIKDLRKSKLRTVIPAHLSFTKDCARILRGLRIVGRLGLHISEETATAIGNFSSSIVSLGQQRLLLELNFMLAYGAAKSSICLLQKFKLLDILLPFQAAYLTDQRQKKIRQDSTMLMKLFANADRLLAADRPADGILWSALLAFHLALVENPQDSLVVSTFSAVLLNGTWKKALEFARQQERVHDVQFVPEIRASSDTKSDELILEEVSHLASLIKSSVSSLTSACALQQSLGRYQISPSEVVLIVSNKMGRHVARLFDPLERDITLYDNKRKTCEINYQLLKKGIPEEIRYVLGKIIMETMNSTSLETMNCNSLHEEIQNAPVQEKNHLRLSSLFTPTFR